jgi:type I restriction enzyme, R subunit
VGAQDADLRQGRPPRRRDRQGLREVFGQGNDFAKKITYQTSEKPKELIKAFRVDPFPRIAVTVDMIATGTDIKPWSA